MNTLNDFKDSKGKIDWKAYKAHEIAIGARCKQCNSLISSIFSIKDRIKKPQKCYDCKQLKLPEETSHDQFIRCPNCQHYWNAENEWEGGIYDDYDVTNVYCSTCDQEFEVKTYISRTYTSPALLKS